MSNVSVCSAAITLVTITVLISGCAMSRGNYSNQAPVHFERIPSKDVFIREVYAYENNDKLLISGKVKRTANNCCDPARGHVDIAVVAPDGLVLDLISVPYNPHNIPKVRTRSSSFTARLPYTPPDDVILKITYHEGPKFDDSPAYADNLLICEQNFTILDGKI